VSKGDRVRQEGLRPGQVKCDPTKRNLVDSPDWVVGESRWFMEGRDGFEDLTLKFWTQDVVAAIGDVSHRDVLVLELTASLNDGTPIVGEDVVVIREKGKN